MTFWDYFGAAIFALSVASALVMRFGARDIYDRIKNVGRR